MCPAPFLLQGTLQHNLQAQSTELAKHIADNIYVDNVSIGVTSIPEGVQMYTQAKDILSSAVLAWICGNGHPTLELFCPVFQQMT